MRIGGRFRDTYLSCMEPSPRTQLDVENIHLRTHSGIESSEANMENSEGSVHMSAG